METKNLQQLNQYRDELLESLEATDMGIIKATRDENKSKLELYRVELIGKYFKVRKFDRRIYKILEVSAITEYYISCAVIRVAPDGIIETFISHNDHSIEITQAEFETQYVETLNNLNQKIK